MVLDSIFARLCSIPAVEKHLWRMLYNFLASRPGGEDWEFMNYGYAADANEASPSLRLYDELARHGGLRDKRLLEVGSGRGGGLRHLTSVYAPAKAIGCDLSPRAVALCRKHHAAMPIEWLVGDAEALPFDEGSIDIVINVESSHCYPHFERFGAEAYRVLAPDGHFVWADFRPSERVAAVRETLRATGFEEILWREITPEVLAAMQIDEPRKEALLQKHVPAWLRGSFRDFAGMLGSKVHQNFVTGAWKYSLAVMRKP